MHSVMDAGPVGSELRRWRELRSLTQLALANQASVSTKHLSFVETGRSRPTPEMITRLADAMQVPLAEQNRLLLAAGFAPRYPHRSTDDPAIAPMMAGLRALLDAHAPYPALLLDDHWDVIDANEAVDTLLVGCHPSLLEPPVNVMRLCLHPLGLAPRIQNLRTWRWHLLHQLDERIAISGGSPELDALRREVLAYADGGDTPSHPVADPVLPLEIVLDHQVLRLFSVSSRLESAADITLEGLHLETFLPADDETRLHLNR